MTPRAPVILPERAHEHGRLARGFHSVVHAHPSPLISLSALWDVCAGPPSHVGSGGWRFLDPGQDNRDRRQSASHRFSAPLRGTERPTAGAQGYYDRCRPSARRVLPSP
jgi:hypothetical protein